MEQWPPRRTSEFEWHELREEDDPLTRWPEFGITVDAQGFFHVRPPVTGGPFRSVGEALAAAEAELAANFSEGLEPRPGLIRELIPVLAYAEVYTRVLPLYLDTFIRLLPWSEWEYHITMKGGLFYAHPPDVGGPFQSLGEAAAAIKCHPAWASITRQMTEGCYFTLKDGLFHIHADGLGGPFKNLHGATDAVWSHHASLKAIKKQQEEKERNRKWKELLYQWDPASDPDVPSMEQIKEMFQRGKRDKSPEPVERSWADDVIASFKPGRCDPAISEAAYRFERIAAEKEAIKNGMKWMQSEALQAFESYKKHVGYRGPKYEFVKLGQQCLIHDTFLKSYHHYNFTMKKKSSFYLTKKAKRYSKKHWDYQVFFAEVKPTKEGKNNTFAGHCSVARMVLVSGVRMPALILDTQEVAGMRREIRTLDFHLTVMGVTTDE